VKGKMYVITPDGEISEAGYYNTVPPLKELRQAVGGSIESVPYWTEWNGQPCWAICNTDGKDPHNYQNPNPLATGMWYMVAPQMEGVDYLHGPVAILTGDDEWMEKL
jgi:hypothetical protein